MKNLHFNLTTNQPSQIIESKSKQKQTYFFAAFHLTCMFSVHFYTLFGIAKEAIAGQCCFHLNIEVPGLFDCEVALLTNSKKVFYPFYTERNVFPFNILSFFVLRTVIIFFITTSIMPIGVEFNQSVKSMGCTFIDLFL